MTTINQKYEITDIAHAQYPFLHRIRALRDIGSEVKASGLGGFVESESNLSFEPGDDAWIFNDAIAANTAYVDKGSSLRDRAVACDHAYISHESVMLGDARAEDDAYVRGSTLMKNARVSGTSMILQSQNTGKAPILSGHCTVYGTVVGDVRVTGKAVVITGEKIYNETRDTLFLNERGRSIVRDASRDELRPHRYPGQPAAQKEKGRKRGQDR